MILVGQGIFEKASRIQRKKKGRMTLKTIDKKGRDQRISKEKWFQNNWDKRHEQTAERDLHFLYGCCKYQAKILRTV